MKYIILPFVAWIMAGSFKFLINYLRYGKKAKNLIGYGGFPSTHTTVLSSVVIFSGFYEGFASPLFSLGMGALLILVIDAHGLRQKVGQQAKIINELQRKVLGNDVELLREKMGHTWIEIFGGLLLGSMLALIFYWV
ncbi:MAG: divergent PAP2 family protein [Anaerovibrio sp.]